MAFRGCRPVLGSDRMGLISDICTDARGVGNSMPSKELQYTRAFEKWIRGFSAAAVKDNYFELLRPLEHLELECSGEHALAATISLVLAIAVYCQMDGRDCKTFLKQQHYRLDSDDAAEYCLIFDLTGLKGSYFGRILTDINFTSIDLEDLFNHPWSMSETAGFTEVYISRLDGKRIGKRELGRLYKQVTSDMFYGYSEEELSVDVSMTDFPDTARIYVVETD
jgi:hypothetical protein